jgi:4-hydroxybenzoate polyprenyltransferase
MPSKTSAAEFLRALVIMGRVSNLPTVWSNCLAGWLLGGFGDWNLLYVLLTGASCLYLGGMYMNDACDVEFDRQYRKERPIPAGVCSEWKVWCLSFMLLASGTVILALLGTLVLKLALCLLVVIMVYNLFHKRVVLAPVLMALCRILLVLIAAAAGRQGPDGLTLWCAVALGGYVAGLSFLAREESRGGPVKYWPSVLLFAPIALCLLVNDGPYGRQALVLVFVLFFWLLGCLITAFGAPSGRLGEAVAKLLAGMVLVDLAAVGPVFPEMVICFPALFIIALIMQRFVPAT